MTALTALVLAAPLLATLPTAARRARRTLRRHAR